MTLDDRWETGITMTLETGGNRPHNDTRCRWETGHTMTLDTGGNRTHNDIRDRWEQDTQ